MAYLHQQPDNFSGYPGEQGEQFYRRDTEAQSFFSSSPRLCASAVIIYHSK
jgi:hypothetical protein